MVCCLLFVVRSLHLLLLLAHIEVKRTPPVSRHLELDHPARSAHVLAIPALLQCALSAQRVFAGMPSGIRLSKGGAHVAAGGVLVERIGAANPVDRSARVRRSFIATCACYGLQRAGGLAREGAF